MALSELKFSDLFLPARIEEAWYKETPSALDRIPVPLALADDIRKLRREMEGAMSGSPDFRIDLDGISAMIRAGDFHLLKSEIERQRRLCHVRRIAVKLVALYMVTVLPCMNAFAGQPTPYMDACFNGAAQYHHVNPVILRSIAKVESGYNPRAFNRNPNGTFDYGVMQINSSWFPTLARYGIRPAQLADPCTNIYVGAWILSDNMHEHGNTWKAIGKYNAASDVAGIRYERKVYGAVMAQLKGDR